MILNGLEFAGDAFAMGSVEADITHVIYKRQKILKLIFIGPQICWRIEGVCRSAKAEFHTGSGCKKPIPDLMDH
jgi:hypothetical protein